jgi:hypothetical protein
VGEQPARDVCARVAASLTAQGDLHGAAHIRKFSAALTSDNPARAATLAREWATCARWAIARKRAKGTSDLREAQATESACAALLQLAVELEDDTTPTYKLLDPATGRWTKPIVWRGGY